MSFEFSKVSFLMSQTSFLISHSDGLKECHDSLLPFTSTARKVRLSPGVIVMGAPAYVLIGPLSILYSMPDTATLSRAFSSSVSDGVRGDLGESGI